MKRRTFLSLAGALLVTPGMPAHAQTHYLRYSGPARTTIKLQKSIDNKLYIITPVNGRALTLFVDTGASSLLDLAVAKEMGLQLTANAEKGYGLSGEGVDLLTTTVDMELGAMKLQGAPFACVEFTRVKAYSRENGFIEFDGIIGNNLLSGFRAVIDYDRMTLTLKRP